MARNTESGGSRTNENGLAFENTIRFDSYISPIDIVYRDDGKILYEEYILNNKILKLTYKSSLAMYLGSKIGAEKILQPDEAFIDEGNMILYILEKKFQCRVGSVDEKIQTGLFKKEFYGELYPEYEIRCAYVLCDWFKKEKYRPEMRFLEKYGVKVMWGDDENYFSELTSWLGITHAPSSPPLSAKVCDITKPIIKWVGGKTQILKSVLGTVPRTMNSYYEPFVGGGSVLFAILSLRADGQVDITGEIRASDSNIYLIDMYKELQSNPTGLYSKIARYLAKYDSYPMKKADKKYRNPSSIDDVTTKEGFYYWMRKKFNNPETRSDIRSALFVAINKTCFRGMYREGPNGFNIPFGNYKKASSIGTEKDYVRVSDLIRDVQFSCCDFAESMASVDEGDFVYMDPPYVPTDATSFVGYVKGGFPMEKHLELFTMIKEFPEGTAWSMSNSNNGLVLDHFGGYNIMDIEARRAINSKNPGAIVTEIIVFA
jgi:DNA adenine methylase